MRRLLVFESGRVGPRVRLDCRVERELLLVDPNHAIGVNDRRVELNALRKNIKCLVRQLQVGQRHVLDCKLRGELLVVAGIRLCREEFFGHFYHDGEIINHWLNNRIIFTCS